MRIQYDDSYFKGILTVGAYGRAGSGLLLSLFDGHPNCIGFQDTILSGYQDWWNSLKSNKGSYVMEDFLDLYQVIFDPTFIHPSRVPPGAGNDFGNFSNMIGNKQVGTKDIYVPKERFSQCLSYLVRRNQEETASSFFKKLHFALSYALGKPLTRDTIIVHGATNGHPKRFDFMRSGFRNVWNILMVRDPVIGNYARIKLWIELNDGKPEEQFIRVINKMGHYYLSQIGWEECTKAVRLEDLKHSPNKTLEKIIKWIDVPWDDSLLQSTFLGKKWYFSQSEIHMKPFNTETISSKRYTHLFSPFDRYRIAICFRKLYDAWGYEVPIRPQNMNLLLNFLTRFKIEQLAGSRTGQIMRARMKLIRFLAIPRFTEKEVLRKLIGENLLNMILKRAGKEKYSARLSKYIIPLL